MSAKELKKMLKDARPKFGSTEEDLKKELEYHTTAKKALANKEKMAKVREARLTKGTEGEKKVQSIPIVTQEKAPVLQEEKQKKAPKEKKTAVPSSEPLSMRRSFLLSQLAALGASSE